MSLFVLCVLLFVVSSRLAPLHVSRSEKTIKDQYIVVFKKEISSDIYNNQINFAKNGLKVGHVYEHTIKGFSAELDSEQLLQLRKNPFVDFIEGDQEVKVADCSNQIGESWGLTRISQHAISLDGSYQASANQGAGVIAYVLDTGVLLTHNEFKPGRASFGWKATPTWSDTDRNGHGTHVSSTIAGKLYGVAKNAEIVAVKVLGDTGSGSWAGVIGGVDYVVQQSKQEKEKKSVANLSIGGGFMKSVNDAIDAAVNAGVTMVVAAGNEDNNACSSSPASAPLAVTVGASDIGVKSGGVNQDVRSYFSNYGPCVTLFAPGSEITGAWWTSDIATNTISGTSMASPHTCGVAALLLGDNPSLSPLLVKENITQMANKDYLDLVCGGDSVCLQSPNLLLWNGCPEIDQH